jgi:hypothetical protein
MEFSFTGYITDHISNHGTILYEANLDATLSMDRMQSFIKVVHIVMK